MTQKDFFRSATTRQAIMLIAWYNWVIVRNAGRVIDRLVHKLPWVCMAVTILLSFAISIVMIGKARSERDRYNKQMVSIQRQLDSYKALYDNDGKEVRP